MKTRYFIFISYKGTSYHGWQIQPNSVTVQKILDNALSVVLNEKISTTGAGRTDTGVHAIFFCAHFDSISTELIVNKNLEFRLNRYLPEDISVLLSEKFFRMQMPGTALFQEPINIIFPEPRIRSLTVQAGFSTGILILRR